MRMSHATSPQLATKRWRRVVRPTDWQSIKRVLRVDRWRREHGLLRNRKRQRVVWTARWWESGLRRSYVEVVGRSIADYVGLPKHLRIVEGGLRRGKLARATRRVLETRTSWLLKVDSQTTREEGRRVIELVLHCPHWKISTHPHIVRIVFRLDMPTRSSEGRDHAVWRRQATPSVVRHIMFVILGLERWLIAFIIGSVAIAASRPFSIHDRNYGSPI
jgi:hypothetical protein